MQKPLIPFVAAAASACIGLGAAVAGTGTSTSGTTPDQDRSEATGVDVQVPDSNERIDDYWTQDRMRAAKPMPTPRISRPSAPPVADDDALLEE